MTWTTIQTSFGLLPSAAEAASLFKALLKIVQLTSVTASDNLKLTCNLGDTFWLLMHAASLMGIAAAELSWGSADYLSMTLLGG